MGHPIAFADQQSGNNQENLFAAASTRRVKKQKKFNRFFATILLNYFDATNYENDFAI
jgi:hypothetical protein